MKREEIVCMKLECKKFNNGYFKPRFSKLKFANFFQIYFQFMRVGFVKIDIVYYFQSLGFINFVDVILIFVLFSLYEFKEFEIYIVSVTIKI